MNSVGPRSAEAGRRTLSRTQMTRRCDAGQNSACFVIPAEAGIQSKANVWTPAYAGVTNLPPGNFSGLRHTVAPSAAGASRRPFAVVTTQARCLRAAWAII